MRAAENLLCFSGDALDAFAHAPAPKSYLWVDEAIAAWILKRWGKRVPRNMVIAIYMALQGHPAAGAIWERLINKILKELGFESTTHEQNIYQATIQGKKYLLIRQTDDFCLGC